MPLSSTSDKPFRIRILGGLILLVILAYVFQLVSLQVFGQASYHQKATLESQRAQPIPAPRGDIFDRNHDVPLATNRDAFDVTFTPGEAPRATIRDELARLALRLPLSIDTLERLVPPEVWGQFLPIELISGVDLNAIRRLAEESDQFPGVHWSLRPLRQYQDLKSLSSVVGYVGDITVEELQVLYNSGYGQRSVVGKAGLEKQYDFLLRGKDGARYKTIDASGRALQGTSAEDPPQPGKTLVLTIDRAAQTLAEKALGDRVGSVVILKPTTGEILAMVSSPSYDANQFLTADKSKVLQSLMADPHFPFLNRSIMALYPPASTFKVIMSAAVLGDGVIDPTRRILSTPEYKLGDRVFKEHDPRGLGWVDLAKALALSANVYFYTVGVEYLGIDRIDRYAREFGLGRPTGVDLPGEVSGLVPDPVWKEKNLHYPWLGGDTANTSIGQGYLQVTPLQMADAVALVSNEGTVYRPHLLKEIRNPETGAVEDAPAPEVLFQSTFPKSVFKPLQDNMRGVITVGTAGPVVTTKAVLIAGKTGTGEDGEKGSNNHSWFVSYAPYDEPDPEKRVVVVVQVERTNTWEWWAPKAANIIYQGLFAHQTYEEAIRTLGPIW